MKYCSWTLCHIWPPISEKNNSLHVYFPFSWNSTHMERKKIMRHHSKQASPLFLCVPSDLSERPQARLSCQTSSQKRCWLRYSILLHSQPFEQMFPPMIWYFPRLGPEKPFTSNTPVQPPALCCVTAFFLLLTGCLLLQLWVSPVKISVMAVN